MNRQTWQAALTRPDWWIELARAALIIMEITLYSLWYQSLFKSAPLSWPAIFGLLGAVMAVSYGLGRGLAASRTRLLVRQGLFLVWLGLAMIGTLKMMVFSGTKAGINEMATQTIQYITLEGSEGASFYHLLVILLLVWRGVTLVGAQISLWRVQVNFQIGLIGLLIYGIALASAHPKESMVGMFLYLFTALVGMSATRIASLADTRDGRVPHLSLGWLAGILLTSLGVVSLAILTGWIASGQVVAWVIRAFVLILTLLTTFLLWLLTPAFTFLAHAISAMADFLQRLANQSTSIRLPKFFEDFLIRLATAAQEIVPRSVVFGRSALIVVIALLALTAILAGLRLRSQQERMRAEENSDTISLQQDNLWRRLLQRILPDPANLRRRKPVQLIAAVRIRRIYHQLMLLSQKLGAARPPALTPLEFLPRLTDLFPTEQEGLALITSAYVKVRYGEYPETLREVEEVQRAWDKIRRQARRKKSLRKT